MPQLIALQQFNVSQSASGVVHLSFDAPGRSMNVFSNAAIHDLLAFVAWLKDAEVPGCVVSSGKTTGFCAGADLDELGVAYDTIVRQRPERRTQVAYEHFIVLSQTLRGLETAGKPVAAAIGGLALGGGCELAMACHHRVLSRHPKAALGLPESLVGLLPGGGGTQRLPRLIGLEASFPILLDAGRLSGEAALASGLVSALVEPGDEIEAAEAWVLTTKHATQPWDKPGFTAPGVACLTEAIAARRAALLEQTLGHYPAPLAILDCLEQGLPQPMDRAIETEMRLFAGLVQRVEPRNMIRGLFRGKIDYEKLRKQGRVPTIFCSLLQEIRDRLGAVQDDYERGALLAAGFRLPDMDDAQRRCLIAAAPKESHVVSALLSELKHLAEAHRPVLDDTERRAADYVLITEIGLPAYMGGLFAN